MFAFHRMWNRYAFGPVVADSIAPGDPSSSFTVNSTPALLLFRMRPFPFFTRSGSGIWNAAARNPGLDTFSGSATGTTTASTLYVSSPPLWIIPVMNCPP